jgi:hypothetical protein
MLKASALFYAIVISLLLGMASGSLILSAYFTRLETDTCLKQEKLQVNALSGIAYLLSSQEEIHPGASAAVDLYGSGEDSVILEKKAWGIYEIVLAHAAWRNLEARSAALAGSVLKGSDRFALWLCDQDRPLSLAGNTVITGDAYLPKAGVQRAYIEGQNYAGSKMVYGNVLQSGRSMLLLDKPLVNRLENILSGQFTGADSISALMEDSVTNSFFNAPLIIRSAGRVVLSGKTYSGHIIIYSGTEIVVTKDASLDGVLIAAPVIRIENEFRGTLQAFAGDTLIAGENCELLYPSALGIIRTARSASHMLLSVSSGSKVRGAVLSWQEQFDVRKSMLINIATGAIITGQVYSAGVTDLKGKVKGSVITNKFLLKTPSSVYENHLLNAAIDISALPVEYGGPVTGNSNKIIMKWVE